MQCITFFKENVATRLCLDDSVKISKNTRRFRCLAEKFAFVKTDYVVSHHCSRTSPHTKFGFVPLPVCGCDCFYISYFIFIIVYIKYSLLLENFVMEPELQIPIVSSKVPPLKTLLCANFKRTHESVIRLLMSKEHIGVDWSPEFKKINLRYNFSEHCWSTNDRKPCSSFTETHMRVRFIGSWVLLDHTIVLSPLAESSCNHVPFLDFLLYWYFSPSVMLLDTA